MESLPDGKPSVEWEINCSLLRALPELAEIQRDLGQIELNSAFAHLEDTFCDRCLGRLKEKRCLIRDMIDAALKMNQYVGQAPGGTRRSFWKSEQKKIWQRTVILEQEGISFFDKQS